MNPPWRNSAANKIFVMRDKMCVRVICIAIVVLLIPNLAEAQGMANRIRSLHEVLEKLYDDMMPLCSRLIGVGRGIAGFAATWYIASRIW